MRDGYIVFLLGGLGYFKRLLTLILCSAKGGCRRDFALLKFIWDSGITFGLSCFSWVYVRIVEGWSYPLRVLLELLSNHTS